MTEEQKMFLAMVENELQSIKVVFSNFDLEIDYVIKQKSSKDVEFLKET